MSEAARRLREEGKRHLWPGVARVLDLPDKTGRGIPDLTEKYALTEEYQLRPIQSEMLQAIEECQGAVCSVGVGHGKTLPSFLAGTVLGAEKPILLVPPSLVKQTLIELERFRPHFNIPRNLEVLSYGKLSVAAGTSALEEIKPDLIVADECHMLRHPSSARTKRVLRYFREHPDTHFVGLSGTLTAKSLKDYAHLVELALRNKAPVPLQWVELAAWASCIDVQGEPTPSDFGVVKPLIERWAPDKKSARAAFQRRFAASPGVVTTEDQSASCSLYLRLDDEVTVPPLLEEEIKKLEDSWTTPGGEELEDPMALARHRRHLISGFYYEWDWPDDKVDYLWLDARKEWHINVRRVLSRSIEGRDSPLLVSRWAESGDCRDLELLRAWEAWKEVKERPVPPTKTIWLDYYLVDYILEKALGSRQPAIVWTSQRAFFNALKERGLPAYGPGDTPPSKPQTCVMSIRAQGTGKNLQAWSRNILGVFPPSGAEVEQLIGRTHRPGQEADEVIVDFFLPHPSVEEDIAKSLESARYIEETQGTRQKLLVATWI
jgi:hypothetical protein